MITVIVPWNLVLNIRLLKVLAVKRFWYGQVTDSLGRIDKWCDVNGRRGELRIETLALAGDRIQDRKSLSKDVIHESEGKSLKALEVKGMRDEDIQYC